jgi:hypothetical protein
MNIQEISDIFTKNAKYAADLMDGAAFAYVTEQLQYIKSIGGNPSDYEVVFVTQKAPEVTEDGYRINSRIRVERRKDIANLLIVEGVKANE